MDSKSERVLAIAFSRQKFENKCNLGKLLRLPHGKNLYMYILLNIIFQRETRVKKNIQDFRPLFEIGKCQTIFQFLDA